MFTLFEKLGDRLLGAIVPAETAHAAVCYGIPVNKCAWICCNTTCTVEKRCCEYLGVCSCSACTHS